MKKQSFLCSFNKYSKCNHNKATYSETEEDAYVLKDVDNTLIQKKTFWKHLSSSLQFYTHHYQDNLSVHSSLKVESNVKGSGSTTFDSEIRRIYTSTKTWIQFPLLTTRTAWKESSMELGLLLNAMTFTLYQQRWQLVTASEHLLQTQMTLKFPNDEVNK